MNGRKITQRGLFAGMALVVASCAQIVGMEEGVLREDGPPPECALLEDCQADATECKTAKSCAGGICVYENVIRGTRLSTQTMGDCRDVVCDGDGATEFVVADMDIENDENECTEDSCKAGNPVHTPIPGKMLACYDGPLGTQGIGICKEGMRACDEQGNPSASCEGQVLPQAEVCDVKPLDENCNGVTNETGPEGGTCQCGDGATSPGIGESCDDGNFVGGDGCSPLCSTVQVDRLFLGGLHTCVLLNSGVVKCWGHNAYGQLGIGSNVHWGWQPTQMGANLMAVDLGTGKTAIDLALGYTFGCAILNDNTVRCWGRNHGGQLGEETTQDRGDVPGEMGDAMPVIDLGLEPGQVVTKVASGGDHSCALISDGSVKCWGANTVGELGYEDTKFRGPVPGTMGVNLPKVNLGTGRTAKALTAGYFFNCAILDDDSVKCWGRNIGGQLGQGDVQHRGATPGTMGDNLPAIDLGVGKIAKQIVAGDEYACAILNDGQVKCWGTNNVGQLGLEAVGNRGDAPGEMGDNLPTVNLGTGRTALELSCGLASCCALLDDGTHKCWGWNSKGQLGLGNLDNRGDMLNEMGDALPIMNLGTGVKAKMIRSGDRFHCALLEDTSVKCWGWNDVGYLGLGDQLIRGDQPNEMGDNLPIVKLFSDTW